MTIERHHTGPRVSQIVMHGHTIYIAGETLPDVMRKVLAPAGA